MNAPRVTVVIPTYNQASFLRRALQSVRDQTMADWEAVIINNHSDDDTVAVVQGFGEARFRLENFHNHGVIAASRNLGISRARGQWVAFLDSDDWWAPDKLALCLDAADEGCDLVSHPETIIRDGKTLGATETATAGRTRFRSLLFNGNCLSPSAVLVRKTALEAVGSFIEDQEIVTAEDYDLWLRLARHGIVCKTVPRALSEFTLHEGSATTSIARHMNAGLAVLDRHIKALDNARPLDGLRARRARAQVIYGAARSFQKTGEHGAALNYLLRSAMIFPFFARLYAAFGITLFSALRRIAA